MAESVDFAALSIGVETAGLDKGAASLDKLASSADALEKVTKSLSEKTKELDNKTLTSLASTLDKTDSSAKKAGGSLGAMKGISGALTNGFNAADGSALDLAKSLIALAANPLILLATAAAAVVALLISFEGAARKAHSELNNMSSTTGVAVEDLGRMRDAARESGQSMDQVAGALIKFQKAIYEARGGSQEMTEVMAKLGVEVSGTTIQSFDRAATSLVQMEEGANKTALGLKLFGKSGAELNEFLVDYVNHGTRASTVTTQMAQDAELLTRNNKLMKTTWDELKESVGGYFIEIEAGLLRSRLLAEGEKLLKQRAALIEQSEKMAAELPAAMEAGFGEDQVRIIARNTAEIDKNTSALELNRRRQGIGQIGAGQSEDQISRSLVPRTGETKDPDWLKDIYKQRLADATTGMNAAKKAADELAKSNDMVSKAFSDIARETFKLNNGDGYPKYLTLVKDIQDNSAKWAKVSDSVKTALIKATIEVDEQEAAVKENAAAWKTYEDAVKKSEAEIKKVDDAIFAANMKIKEQNDELELEHKMLGLSSDERKIYIANLKLSKAETEGNANTVDLLTKNLGLLQQQVADKKYLEAIKEQTKEIETQKKAWDALADKAVDFFTDLVVNGRSAFKKLGSDLKEFFIKELINMTVKKWLVSIGASVIGGGAAASGGAAGSAASSGLSSLIGPIASSIGSSITSYLGIGAGSTFAATSGAGFSLGLEALGTVAMEGVAAVGGLGSALGSLTAVLGPVILALGALYLAWTIFGTKPGGPKGGGFARTGNTSGIRDTDNSGRWFTPNTEDAAVSGIVKGVSDSYDSLYKLFGGKGTTNSGFALGFDTDPKGTAPNRIHSGAWVNGVQVYDNALGDSAGLGRDQATLTAAMQLESKRMLLAALQASDLPKDISKILNIAAPKGATEETIDQLLSFASAMTVVNEIMSKDVIAEAVKLIADASLTVEQQIAKQGTTLTTMAAAFDGTAASSEKMAAAAAAYYQNVVQVLAAIEQMKGKIKGMFGDSIEGWKKDTQSDPERKTYIVSEIARLKAEMATTTSADVVATNAAKINALMNEQWNLLSDAEKKVQLQAYIDAAKAIDKLATDQLTAIQKTIKTQFDNVMTGIHDTMMAVAQKMADGVIKLATANEKSATAAESMLVAANTQKIAADTQQNAANTPININVKVSNDGGSGNVNG